MKKASSIPAGVGGYELIDAEALMRIESLELRAKTVVEGFMQGQHRSPFHGFSVEFTEYRHYTHGDDTRHVDWRLLARSDRCFIKKYEDETNLRCHILIDQSRSMEYGSGSYSKSVYAATMAATFAQYLFSRGDAVGVFTFDEQIREYIPARNRPGHLRRLLHILDRNPEGTSTSLGEPLRRVAEMLNRRGMVILISDLLAPIDTLREKLGYLTSHGHDVLIFQVLDPREVDFELDTASRYYDLESQKDLYIDPSMIREEYQEKLEAHLKEIREAAHDLGIDYFLQTSDRSVELALYDFLSHREKTHRFGAGSRRQQTRRGAR